jgi:hypothetical protein
MVFMLLVSTPGSGDSVASTNGYERMSGCDKQDYLWQEKLLPTEYRDKPGLNFGGWRDLIGLLKAPTSVLNLAQTFDNVSDEMPVGKPKIVHAFGSVAKVIFKSSKTHPYTGLFAADEVCGLARLSVAGSPLAIGFTPGMALKLFVDGKPSVNIEVMNSLEGQGSDWNFFARSMTNSLPRTRISLMDSKTVLLKVAERALARVKPDPLYLPVTPFAEIDVEGARIEHPIAPRVIVFSPLEAPNAVFRNNEDQDFRDVLAKIPVGTPIYEVYGLDASNKRVLIGTLETASPFVASQYGDQRLFFRHNR